MLRLCSLSWNQAYISIHGNHFGTTTDDNGNGMLPTKKMNFKDTRRKAVYYAIWFRASDFNFAIWKKMGLLMQSDFGKKIDGIKSDSRIRWPKSSHFRPKSQGSLRLSVRARCVFLKTKIPRSGSVRFSANSKSYGAVLCGFPIL